MKLREFGLPVIGLAVARPVTIGFPEDPTGGPSHPPAVGVAVSNLIGERNWNMLLENGRVILLEHND